MDVAVLPEKKRKSSCLVSLRRSFLAWLNVSRDDTEAGAGAGADNTTPPPPARRHPHRQRHRQRHRHRHYAPFRLLSECLTTATIMTVVPRRPVLYPPNRTPCGAAPAYGPTLSNAWPCRRPVHQLTLVSTVASPPPPSMAGFARAHHRLQAARGHHEQPSKTAASLPCPALPLSGLPVPVLGAVPAFSEPTGPGHSSPSHASPQHCRRPLSILWSPQRLVPDSCPRSFISLHFVAPSP